MIDKEDSLSVTRQCDILELSRSGIYYTPVPVSVKDMELMRQIDKIILCTRSMAAGISATNYGSEVMMLDVTGYVV